jgi:hypothetical protein
MTRNNCFSVRGEQLDAAKGVADQRQRDAVKAGWTEKELTAIGFDLDGTAKPARKSRPKKSTPSTPAAAQPATATAEVTT